VHALATSVRNYRLIACLAVCLAGLTYNFTGYALLDPDEGRNAEIAREMATTGDFVLPHLNALPYLDKPTLYFAIGAITMKILGPTVLAARLPSLLFTLATITLAGWFARRIFGRGAAATAVIATAATPFTLAYARIVIFDSALTFFVVSALVGFYLAVEEHEDVGRADGRTGGRELGGEAETPTAVPPYRRTAGGAAGWTAIAWVAMAFGVLTKGPIAFVLPLLVAVPFALRYKAGRALADPVAVLLFFAIVSPWVIAVSLRVPGFLEYALVTETLRRFSTHELGRTGPIWYFLAILPAAAVPWSLVLAGIGASRIRRGDRGTHMDRRFFFLLLWIVVPLAFFTLSQSKRPQYVLPLMPAVALLTAGSWQANARSVPGSRWGAVGLFSLGLFLAFASRVLPSWVPASPDIAAAIPGTAVTLGVVCACAGVLAWFARHHRDLLVLAFSLPVAAIPFSSRGLMEEIGNERSAALLAEAVDGAAGQGATLVGVGVFPPSLPFYLRTVMIVSTADGSELTSNYLTRHLGEYRGFGFTMRRADWWQQALLACSQPTVFVSSSDDRETREALGRLSLIADNGRYAAYGPCGAVNLVEADR
jgi:4-amino-4-deoxy-L-arabinose transferase-like glycosyltransferase